MRTTFALVIACSLLVVMVPAASAQESNPRCTVDGFGILAVSEAGTSALYGLSLGMDPNGIVQVLIASAAGHVRISPSLVTFTARDWDSPHMVRVRPINDRIDEPDSGGIYFDTLTYTMLRTTPECNQTDLEGSTATVSVTDNDVAAILVSQTAGATHVSEGGRADLVRVRLATQPLADVTVTLDYDDGNLAVAGQPDGSSLTFTPTNWNRPQGLRVLGVVDGVADDLVLLDSGKTGPGVHELAFLASSGDGQYDQKSAAVEVQVTDTTGGLKTFDRGFLYVDGSTNDTVQVALTAKPTGLVTVVVSASTSHAALNGANPLTLRFRPSDWMTPQAVVIADPEGRSGGADCDSSGGLVPGFTLTLDPDSTRDPRFAAAANVGLGVYTATC